MPARAQRVGGVKATVMNTPEYHLIDLSTGESHGGWVSLEAAREEARALNLTEWQIWNGDNRVEQHNPESA